ncbi:MAG: thiamine pyrophosphate-dependent dehydrogenase E1 component subunit alpha [Actinobacteria bacterium]|nr:thiamine pyrophosphate-dependent dehydrogenase E1 component subunit alpha [Actinomycetota bacterium]
MLRLMLTARVLEQRLADAYADGKLTGWIHSCEGHEALGGALAVCFEDRDHLVPHYRSRPEQLAKGMSVREVVAEVFATVDAASGGRGGETHVSSVANRIYGMTGVLGANIALATGVALASKLQGTDEVTVCSFGDGTANRGTFHEALNLAAIWDLPVVFICENNYFAELSKISDFIRVENIADRAAAYGIAGHAVDGHDPEELVATLRPAIAAARAGRPCLVEAKMIRRRGHWEGDPQAYRDAAEVGALDESDPVPSYRAHALESGLAGEDEIAAWEEEAAAEVEEAIAWAEGRPLISAADAVREVYAGEADV